MKTFKTYVEQQDSINDFIKNQYPNIKPMGMTQKDIRNWFKKEGLVGRKTTSDEFAKNIKAAMMNFR